MRTETTDGQVIITNDLCTRPECQSTAGCQCQPILIRPRSWFRRMFPEPTPVLGVAGEDFQEGDPIQIDLLKDSNQLLWKDDEKEIVVTKKKAT